MKSKLAASPSTFAKTRILSQRKPDQRRRCNPIVSQKITRLIVDLAVLSLNKLLRADPKCAESKLDRVLQTSSKLQRGASP